MKDKTTLLNKFSLSQRIDDKSHFEKVQKYQQGKIGLQFFICGANNVGEHFGKKSKILHGCPFAH